MSENIIQFLNSWCTMKCKSRPDYNTTSSNVGRNQNAQFKCNVTVQGYDYVGCGISKNKKDAQGNAAKDFTDYLLRENLISGKSQGSVNSTPHVCNTSISAPLIVPSREMVGPRQMPIVGKSYWTNLPEQTKIVKVVKEEPKIDTLDESLSDYSTSCLSLFLKKNGIEADYTYSEYGPAHCKSYLCESSFNCPQLERVIYAREYGASRQQASQSCALSSLKQLSRLNVATNFETLTATQKFEQISAFKVNIDPEVEKLIDEVLSDLSLTVISKPPLASQYNQVSMISDISITDFMPQLRHMPQILPWSPPIPNWHAWTSSIIDAGNEMGVPLDEMSRRLKYAFVQKRSSEPEQRRTTEESDRLAVSSYRGVIMRAVTDCQVIMIAGEPGSGKTTQVPQFILDHYIQLNKGAECNIVVTQPTRIAALTAADRVSRDRGESLGQSCGYAVRFDSVLSQPYGGILYCSVGTLLRKMEAGLRGISHIIVDEIQERDSNTDFLLMVLRNMARTYPALKLIIMSSSADVQLFKNFFPGIFSIELHGRSYPVSHYFLEDVIQMLDYEPTTKADIKGEPILELSQVGSTPTVKCNGPEVNCNELCLDSYKPSTKAAMAKLPENDISFELIEALLKFIDKIQPEGSILVFLPGNSTIQMLLKHLQRNPMYCSNKFLLLTLHSKVTIEDQRKLFQAVDIGVRKIVLSTKIAEACISISDVVFVIDTCRERMSKSKVSKSGADGTSVWASKSSLEQRRRCAGSLRQGYTFHLCSRSRFDRLEVRQTSEILRSPLYEIILLIKLLRLGDTQSFLINAIEKPLFSAIVEGESFLKEMKALDYNDELTPIGYVMARLPIEPKMAKMIIFGCLFGVADACSILVAYTSLGDPLIVTHDRHRLTRQQVDLAGGRCSDHVAFINAFQKWDYIKRGNQITEEMFCESKDLNLLTLRKAKEASKQMKTVLKSVGFPDECFNPKYFDCRSQCPSLDNVISLLVIGLYPNVCYHKEKKKLLTNQCKSASIHKSSVTASPYIDSFTSPFLMYGNKICSRTVACKQVSMVNPIQLLLFGASKVVYQNQIIVIDDWLFLDAEFELVAKILALRTALNSLLISGCINPAAAVSPNQTDVKLMSVVAKLGDPNACDHGRSKLFGVSLSVKRKRKNSEPPIVLKAEKVLITEDEHNCDIAKSSLIEHTPVVEMDSAKPIGSTVSKCNSHPNLENDPIRSTATITRNSKFIQNAWSVTPRSSNHVSESSSSTLGASNDSAKIITCDSAPIAVPGKGTTKTTSNPLVNFYSTAKAGNHFVKLKINNAISPDSIPFPVNDSRITNNDISAKVSSEGDLSKTDHWKKINFLKNVLPKQKSNINTDITTSPSTVNLESPNPIKSVRSMHNNFLKKVPPKHHDQKSNTNTAITGTPSAQSGVAKLSSVPGSESDPVKTVRLMRNNFLKKVPHKLHNQTSNSKSAIKNHLSNSNQKIRAGTVKTLKTAAPLPIDTSSESLKVLEEDGMDFTSLYESEAKYNDIYGYPIQPPRGSYNIGRRSNLKKEKDEEEDPFCDPISEEEDEDQVCGGVLAFSRRGIVTRLGGSRSRGAIVRNFRGREAEPSSGR